MWIQLGVPDMAEGHWGENIPIAAGYTRSWLQDDESVPQMEWKILDPDVATFAGDEALLREVLAAEPQLVCLSCYLWNIERSIWLAGEVKKIRPGTLIILGGPEINPDSPWWPHPAADALVSGEAETGLPIALERLGNSSRRPVLVTAPPFDDLDHLRDPYSAGILRPNHAGGCFIESMRGCPYNCHYCFYAKQFSSVRHFNPEHIREFFQWAQGDDAVKDIYLIDPSFNITPGLDARLEQLAMWNTRTIPLHTEIRLETIDSKRAGAMARAGFKSVEAGLQSIHSPVCAGVGRHLDLDRFLQGARAAREHGLEVEIGMILGLPEDDLAGFTRSMYWLAENGLADEAIIFPLSVLPGTRLRERSRKEKWEVMPGPPYHLLENDNWDRASLLEGLQRTEDILGRRHFPGVSPYSDPALPGNRFRRRVRLDLDSADWLRELKEYIPELATPSSIELEFTDFHQVRDQLSRLAGILNRRMPHSLFRVILMPQRPLPDNCLSLLTDLFRAPADYWTRLHYFHPEPGTQSRYRFFCRPPEDSFIHRSWPVANLPLVLKVPETMTSLRNMLGNLRQADLEVEIYLVHSRPLVGEFEAEIQDAGPHLLAGCIRTLDI